MSANSTPQTKKAGLIVTFYGRRDEMLPLQERIADLFNFPIFSSYQTSVWDSYKKAYMYRFDPPVAHDTTIVQLALSESDDNKRDDAQTVWLKKRRELEMGELSRMLDEMAAQKNQANQSIFWGYSLIYYASRAESAPNADSFDEQALNNLFQLAIRPNRNAQVTFDQQYEPEPLAESHLKGVDLWLMDIPNEGYGAKAAMVYVALLPPDRDKELRTKVLYGKGSALLMPDLIAHKAYDQRRQSVLKLAGSQESLIDLYKRRVGELRDTIGPFLGFSRHAADQLPPKESQKSFGEIKFRYNQLLYATSQLDEPRLSLAQQLTNYAWWQKRLGTGDLAGYHYKQIEIAKEELELLIEKGQRMLDATQTTIEMEQAELEQRRELRESQIAALIGILGVALAVSQIIDPEAAKALLILSNIPLPPDNRLVQLLVQLLITPFLTGLIYWLYHKWRKKASP